MSGQHDIGEARLRMALLVLRRDIEPGHDLWPGIATRLSSQSVVARPPRRVWPLAMAASLLLALGLARQGGPDMARPVAVAASAPAAVAPAPAAVASVASEAEALTLHYQAALRELDVRAAPVSWQPGLDALDHGAQQVLAALRHDPQSPQLLERLRQLYARRLALSRRALFV